MMTITAENYFSQEANLHHMGASQFKSLMSCEAAALADLSGEYEREKTTALLVGSYVDAHFEGTLDIFGAKNPEIFTKQGTLKAEYKQAEEIICRVERDPIFMKYMAGDKQVIMTGEIEGVPFKIKIDSFHPGKAIVDMKIMRELQKVWDAESRVWRPWWKAWRYDIQGAIYQEIVRQNTGERPPFFLAAASKEKTTDLDVGCIYQGELDAALELVKENAPRFQEIKMGRVSAARCEKCDYCKFTKVLTEISDYREEA